MIKILIAGIVITGIVFFILWMRWIYCKPCNFWTGKPKTPPPVCDSENFYVKLSDLKMDKLRVLHIWTNDNKYYKQEGVMVPGGIESEKEIVEITKYDFIAFCKKKFSPDRNIYQWYMKHRAHQQGINKINQQLKL